ncbi:MAG: hypothetical protein MUQ25_20270 [Candidatus Aminicenantes bacterium]|nr:hypothetical protein [Candidatus Aminicenantes bacterium]
MFMDHASFALIVCQGYPFAKSLKEPRDDAGLERSAESHPPEGPRELGRFADEAVTEDMMLRWMEKPAYPAENELECA